MILIGRTGARCTVAGSIKTCYNSHEFHRGKESFMAKYLTILRRIIAAATILVTFILCFGCINLYCSGQSNENLVNGVYLSPVFTREIVTGQLLHLAPLLVLYGLLIAIGLVAQVLSRNTEEPRPIPCFIHHHDIPHKEKWRLILFLLSLLFMLLGVINGGARDVLIKAINICTECIGLG